MTKFVIDFTPAQLKQSEKEMNARLDFADMVVYFDLYFHTRLSLDHHGRFQDPKIEEGFKKYYSDWQEFNIKDWLESLK